jgi:hypothetical protein
VRPVGPHEVDGASCVDFGGEKARDGVFVADDVGSVDAGGFDVAAVGGRGGPRCEIGDGVAVLNAVDVVGWETRVGGAVGDEFAYDTVGERLGGNSSGEKDGFERHVGDGEGHMKLVVIDRGEDAQAGLEVNDSDAASSRRIKS